MKILLIDNYDSFTFNLYHYLSSLKTNVNVLRNDKINDKEIIKKKYNKIVISPGPGNPNQSGNCIKIVKKSLEGIRKIYRSNYRYKKAGVILYGLSKHGVTQGLLDYDREVSDRMMQTIDTINNRYGSSTLKIASEGIKKTWKMRRENVSQCYTTRFDELVEVNA